MLTWNFISMGMFHGKIYGHAKDARHTFGSRPRDDIHVYSARHQFDLFQFENLLTLRSDFHTNPRMCIDAPSKHFPSTQNRMFCSTKNTYQP